MNSSSWATEVEEHSEATLVRLSREREIPGMFMDVMNIPCITRKGAIPRDSEPGQLGLARWDQADLIGSTSRR